MYKSSFEEQFVLALNEKQVKELNENLKNLLSTIYGPLNEEEKIYSNLVGGNQKPNIYIEYKMRRTFISIKNYKSVILHQENIKSFILFLRNLGISDQTQKTILYFHFGDGTLNGTGKNRLNYNRLKRKLIKLLEQATEELNQNKNNIKCFINRCLFSGDKNGNIECDYIYYGDINKGILISKEKAYKVIDMMKWEFIENPHIGPLTFRPHNRYIGKLIKKEENRWKVDVYWPTLFLDIEYMSKIKNDE